MATAYAATTGGIGSLGKLINYFVWIMFAFFKY